MRLVYLAQNNNYTFVCVGIETDEIRKNRLNPIKRNKRNTNKKRKNMQISTGYRFGFSCSAAPYDCDTNICFAFFVHSHSMGQFATTKRLTQSMITFLILIDRLLSYNDIVYPIYVHIHAVHRTWVIVHANQTEKPYQSRITQDTITARKWREMYIIPDARIDMPTAIVYRSVQSENYNNNM